MKRFPALAISLCCVAFAACGGGDEPAAPPPASSGVDGKQLFSSNCSNCHTLAAAGASGQVGPNLDQLQPSADLVRTQTENGGGAMPSFKGRLSAEEIQALADYVAENAGSS